VLKHIGPLSAGACMTVLQVLAKVIGAVELLGLVALAEFVNCAQVLGSCIPVRRIGKFVTAVPANISRRWVDR
jgi:hypothetical protein